MKAAAKRRFRLLTPDEIRGEVERRALEKNRKAVAARRAELVATRAELAANERLEWLTHYNKEIKRLDGLAPLAEMSPVPAADFPWHSDLQLEPGSSIDHHLINKGNGYAVLGVDGEPLRFEEKIAIRPVDYQLGGRDEPEPKFSGLNDLSMEREVVRLERLGIAESERAYWLGKSKLPTADEARKHAVDFSGAEKIKKKAKPADKTDVSGAVVAWVWAMDGFTFSQVNLGGENVILRQSIDAVQVELQTRLGKTVSKTDLNGFLDFVSKKWPENVKLYDSCAEEGALRNGIGEAIERIKTGEFESGSEIERSYALAVRNMNGRTLVGVAITSFEYANRAILTDDRAEIAEKDAVELLKIRRIRLPTIEEWGEK